MSILKNQKRVCSLCNWHGDVRDLLIALNPFDARETIVGCPMCEGNDCMNAACDVDDCWEPVTCGTPTAAGYRLTCSKHMPREAK